MYIEPFKMDILRPPQDDLLSKIKNSKLTLQEGDVIALSSKVVAIHQGRCVAREGADKDILIKAEADLYLDRSETPGGYVMHTIINNTFIPNSGIDPFAEHYVLWPENPKKTAEEFLTWFKREYKVEKLYLVLTDSHSMPLRRGVVGIAIAWAGFDPLYDNRMTLDLLGTPGGGSQTNLPDSIAASAVLVMGEANEQTPLVRLRNVPYVGVDYVAHKPTATSFEVSKDEDIFAPFLKVDWNKGGATSS
jgi:F420-0:gamma-glutamyl ligase